MYEKLISRTNYQDIQRDSIHNIILPIDNKSSLLKRSINGYCAVTERQQRNFSKSISIY